MSITLQTNLDLVLQLLAVAAGITGASGFFWGIFEYKQSQKVKRQQLLFDLINTFDDEKSKMFVAKRLLDDFEIISTAGSINGQSFDRYYSNQLNVILRDHHKQEITNKGEAQIRESFDALLDFFGKLEYLRQIGLITKNELTYFKYFIIKTRDNKAVVNYMKIYEFPLCSKLLTRYKPEQK